MKPFPKIAKFPSAEDGLRAMVEHAPQAEALAATWIVRVRPYALLLYALRRRIATGAVGLLAAWLFVHVMLGANGMVVYRQKRAEYQELHKRINVISGGAPMRRLYRNFRFLQYNARQCH